VIKCGLAPVLLDLMRRGYATAFTMNGAASIHDFEIALAGHTSEDVESVLPDGKFGSAQETGSEMNAAIVDGVRDGLGMANRWGVICNRGNSPAPPKVCSTVPTATECPLRCMSPWERIRRIRFLKPTVPPSRRDAHGFSNCSAVLSASWMKVAFISTWVRRFCCRRYF
jgi:hypothetical protein